VGERIEKRGGVGFGTEIAEVSAQSFAEKSREEKGKARAGSKRPALHIRVKKVRD
jgi:hypothetical protein